MYQEGKIALTRSLISDLSHIEISKQMHMFITCIWVQNKKNSVNNCEVELKSYLFEVINAIS